VIRIAAFEDLLIFRDLSRRRPQCAPHNVDAGLFCSSFSGLSSARALPA